MQGSLHQELSLDELSSVAGLSPSHYSSLFKSHTGSSPLRFFTRLRMQKASEFLETTDLPIKIIADKLGFEDTFYFGRSFKKINGVSPSVYRKAIRKTIDLENSALTPQSIEEFPIQTGFEKTV